MTHYIMTNLDKPQIRHAIGTAQLRLAFLVEKRTFQWYEIRPFIGQTAVGDLWVLAPSEDISTKEFDVQRKVYDEIVWQIGQFRDPDAKNTLVQVFFAENPSEYTR